MKNWWFSIVLMLGYLGVFHVWVWTSDRAVVVLSAIGVCAMLTALGCGYRSYFVNRWDRAGHAVVVLDIALEGLLIPEHSHYGFYLCAAAFAAVVGGYRAWRLRRALG
jgi:hypothetical protein